MKMKRVISLLLCLSLFTGMIPGVVGNALAAQEVNALDDGFITVSVADNGGFTIATNQGDRLRKSDDNKQLLYHNGEYDTSFVSFRVTEGGKATDYLFGGVYGGLSDPSRRGVTVTKSPEGNSISAVWATGDLVFTQIVELPNTSSREHGLVNVSIEAENKGNSPVEIDARVLLDTCLGSQDYGVYQLTDSYSQTTSVTTERVVDTSQYSTMQTFYAMDATGSPNISAYSFCPNTPYQVAFGHWNNLAASLFDFSPDATIDFTDAHNAYLTADSAYALYYDMGDSVAPGGKNNIQSYYGVYSHQSVPNTDSVAVDVAAPLSLSLNAERDGFVRQSDVGNADFAVSLNLTNTSEPLEDMSVVVSTTGNLRLLNDDGQPMDGYGFESYSDSEILYRDVATNQTISNTLYFQARPVDDAAYERISIDVYSGSGDDIVMENLIGRRTAYVLLPGNDGSVPEVSFTSMSPIAIYNSGTRYLFVATTNEGMLDDRGRWNLLAYSVSDVAQGATSKGVIIPHENITIASGTMTVALTDDINLAPGVWSLQLEWTDDAQNAGIARKNVTSTALCFLVSDDPQYKDDSYGVVCVVEYNESNNEVYRIESFKSEAEFQQFQNRTNGEDWVEILLIFRGQFAMTDSVTAGTYPNQTNVGTYFTATSTKVLDDGEFKADNPITINDCLDYEGGAVHIYYERHDNGAAYDESEIRVEFIGSDGHLYTSDARTSVWQGVAALSPIVQGEPFSLREYDANGNRNKSFTDNTIVLVWPSVLGYAQTISGLAFKLAYGELGVMKDGDTEIGRVLSFTAALNLSFTGASDTREPWERSGFSYWEKMQSFVTRYRNDSLYDYDYGPTALARELTMETLDESGADNQEQKVKASAMVQDILFGCGQGLVGLNFNVSLMLKNYISGLPNLEANLSVNTINNWAFGIGGSFQLADFNLTASVSFKSRYDIPLLDSFYVSIAGFKPGVNIDGCGVVWVTGGGGGISNLYNSIFLTQAVPPLKLIMTVSFNLLQVLEGKATLGVGLTGVSLKAENLKIRGTNLVAIKRAGLALEWYPGIDLQASVVVDLFQGVLYGGGYIVLVTNDDYGDVFFEMFARVQVCLPGSIPVVGGLMLMGADVGLSSEKIWGALEVLGIALGITYYWGDGDVDFSAGSKAQPTYPNLLGYQESIPIGYDAGRDQTLYARIGTNVGLVAAGDEAALGGAIVLMDASDAWAKSDMNRTSHQFNMGKYTAGNDGIVQLSFDAESMDDARAKAATFKIGSSSAYSANDFGLVLYDTGKTVEQNAAAGANANVTWDSAAGKGTLAFTVTDESKFAKNWYVSTGNGAAELLLYSVAEPPAVETVSATISGGKVTVSCTGRSMTALDSVSFYLTTQSEAQADAAATAAAQAAEQSWGGDESGLDAAPEMDGGYLLGTVTGAEMSGGSHSFAIPAGLPSGEYYLRAVYSQEDVVSGMVYSVEKVSHTNPNTPGKPVASMQAAGNLEFEIRLDDAGAQAVTGYSVSLFDKNDNPTDVENQCFDKSSEGDTVFRVGGSYSYTDPDTQERIDCGLSGGTDYYAVIRPYNMLDNAIVYGPAYTTAVVKLPKMRTPVVSISANVQPIALTGRTITGLDASRQPIYGESVTQVYAAEDITFTAAVDQSVAGTWMLDNFSSVLEVENGVAKELPAGGEFTGARQISIPLSGLDQGSHTLSLTGANAGGDAFRHDYVFTVDTLPPQLLLSSPQNGGFFPEDGLLTISGVTDAGALFTVKVNGATVVSDEPVVTDSSGLFRLSVRIPEPGASSELQLTVIASDAVGNETTRQMSLTHAGLANLASLKVFANGAAPADNDIPNSAAGRSVTLDLLGVTKAGNEFIIDSPYISWQATAAEGGAFIDDEGSFTMGPASFGFVVGRLQVADGAWLTASATFGSTEIGDAPGNALSGYYLTAGDRGDFNIPSDADPNTFTAYYMENGQRVYVQLSAVIDGRLSIIAPVTGVYRLAQNDVRFVDIDGHWAHDNIMFAAARNLFNGVGGNRFAPDGLMTRAMFVTVLWRFASSPEPQSSGGLSDVREGVWYEKAVSWASENNIVNGFGDGTFRPNDNVTREQMCALIARYLDYAGHKLKEKNRPAAFADDSLISSWARESVGLCQTTGLIEGRGNNMFAPLANATRAENCAVFQRMIIAILSTAE